MEKRMGTLWAVIAAAFVMLFSSYAIAEDAPKAAQPPAAAATSSQIIDQLPAFDIKDIFGRIITPDQLKGWVVMYGFGNEKNADVAVEWLKQLTLSHPQAEGILFVVVADSSSYTRVLQPMVKKILKREYKKHMQDIRARMAEKGIKLDYQLEDRYILVSDTKAALFDTFGISGKEREKPHLIFVDGTGKVRAHFTDYTDDLPKTLAALLDERASQQKYSGIKMQKRKKNMMVRYGILGVIVGLLVF